MRKMTPSAPDRVTMNAASPTSGCPGSVPYANPKRSASSTTYTIRYGANVHTPPSLSIRTTSPFATIGASRGKTSTPAPTCACHLRRPSAARSNTTSPGPPPPDRDPGGIHQGGRSRPLRRPPRMSAQTSRRARSDPGERLMKACGGGQHPAWMLRQARTLSGQCELWRRLRSRLLIHGREPPYAFACATFARSHVASDSYGDRCCSRSDDRMRRCQHEDHQPIERAFSTPSSGIRRSAGRWRLRRSTRPDIFRGRATCRPLPNTVAGFAHL